MPPAYFVWNKQCARDSETDARRESAGLLATGGWRLTAIRRKLCAAEEGGRRPPERPVARSLVFASLTGTSPLWALPCLPTLPMLALVLLFPQHPHLSFRRDPPPGPGVAGLPARARRAALQVLAVSWERRPRAERGG